MTTPGGIAMLLQIPPEYFSEVPSTALDHIEDALQYSRGERTLQDILEDLMQGKKQLWLGLEETPEGRKHQSTIITRVVQHPRKKTCIIEYAGGEQGSMLCKDYEKAIQDWAEYNGCDELQIIGRPGWERAMREQGYKKQYTVIGKPIGGK